MRKQQSPSIVPRDALGRPPSLALETPARPDSLVRLLLDPSRAKDLPADSTALRMLEAASLALNLAAFYLIVMLNKKLLKDPSKGGYGLKGVATLSSWHYFAQCCILWLSGIRPKPFAKSQRKMRLALILITAVSPLASNLSLSLNSVSTYQLFKLLQTPLLALVEFATGFRSLSFVRGLLMLGVSCGVGWAEMGPALESQGHDGQSKGFGIVWALVAVCAASAFKLLSGDMVRSGMTPAQFLLNIIPYSTLLLMIYAIAFEPHALRQLAASTEEGGLGRGGWAIFFASGIAGYLVQFTQAVAVGATSALAHALTGQAKTASMLVLSPILYDEATSAAQFVGGAIAMACLVLYVYANVKEMEAHAAASHAKTAKPDV